MQERSLELKKNMIWNFIGNFLYMATQWILTIVVVQLAGYTVSGEFALAISVTNIFYAIAVFGVRNFQVSDVDNLYSDNDYIELRIFTNLGSAIGCLLFSIFSGYSMYQCFIIMLYMGFKISESFIDVFHGIIQKSWRLDIIGQSFLLRSFFNTGFFAFFLYVSKNLAVSILAMSISSYSLFFLFDVRKSKNIAIHRNKYTRKVKMLFWKLLPFAVYYCLINIMGSVPRWFLEKFYGEELLGYYASLATPTAIVQVMANYIFSPLIPLFSGYYHSHNLKGFKQLFLKTVLGVTVLSLISLVVSLILGRWGLKLLYGEEILNYYDYFIPLVFCAIITAFDVFLGAILTVFREIRGLILANGIGVILGIILALILIPSMGMCGTNIAWLSSLIFTMLLMVIFVWRKVYT